MEKKNKKRKTAGKVLRRAAKSLSCVKSESTDENIIGLLSCFEYDASQKAGMATVDLFCKVCWKMNSREREKVLSVLKRYAETYPLVMIPKFVRASFYYHPLLTLAFDVLRSLQEDVQKRIDIPDAGWTHFNEQWTPVCEGQYLSGNGLKIGKTEVLFGKQRYYLPLSISDLESFSVLLKMAMITNTSLLIYTP